MEQLISQLAISMGRLQSQGKLPSHTEKNPKHNVSAFSLRTRKCFEGPSIYELEYEAEKESEHFIEGKEAGNVEEKRTS